ncbi:hypothetical protein BJY00DRAFT_313024 [Aspergillus carlsbadensis]|nr:hypothetical protein BJY00DRAFT_313024 [Aspergillus carlsbadensis]
MSAFSTWPSEALLASFNEEPVQERRYTLICQKESPIGTAAATAMSILGVKYRVQIEEANSEMPALNMDLPALNLNVPNDTVLVHGREILAFIVKNHDHQYRISYPDGSLMASKVQGRMEEVIEDIENMGKDAGPFCALTYGLVWSREQWTVGRKVTMPDLLLLPYVYALYGRLKTSEVLPRIDDWVDRLMHKPAVRTGMERAGWEMGTDEDYEEMFDGWAPRVERYEADQGMRSLGDQFFAAQVRSGSIS